MSSLRSFRLVFGAVLVTIVSLLSSGAWAKGGGFDGGGGKGVLCDGHLSTLDLYEAEHVFKWKLKGSADSFEENLKRFVPPLARQMTDDPKVTERAIFKNGIAAFVRDEIMKRFVFIEKGQRLPLTKDATLPALPANCKEVQIAIYQPDGRIEVDPEYWAMLSGQGQASLVMHEWIYAFDREKHKASFSSDESRRIIASIFAGRSNEPVLGALWESGFHVWCGAGGGRPGEELFELYAVKEIQNGVPGVGLYFHAFKGEYQLSRTSGFIPNIGLLDFLSLKFHRLFTTVRNPLREKQWIFVVEAKPVPPRHVVRMRSGVVEFEGMEDRTFAMAAFSPGEGETAPPLSPGFCRIERGKN